MFQMDLKLLFNSLIFVIVLAYPDHVTATDCPDTWVAFEGSCYLFGHPQLSFFEAEHYCNQHNGHLVHVENAQENAFLKDFMRYEKGDMWWMGLTDDGIEGIWKWYGSSEKVVFTDWVPGTPDDFGSGEDCAEFDFRAVKGWDGKWNDAPCNMLLSPLCEIERNVNNGEIIG